MYILTVSVYTVKTNGCFSSIANFSKTTNTDLLHKFSQQQIPSYTFALKLTNSFFTNSKTQKQDNLKN